MKRIVVTGANRGIGYEISRQLAEKGHQVILTGRNKKKGLEAVESLKNDGLDVLFMQLDLEDDLSITSFSNSFIDTYDHLDVLINNAAILDDSGYHLKDIPLDVYDRMIHINMRGPIALTQKMLPLLQQSNDPRVINISSGMGALSGMGSGYPAYRISKTALNAFTVILAREHPNIKVNSVCPGWVRTDMGGAGASRSVEKGAETPVFLALEGDIPTGKFLRDKKIIDW